MQTRRVPGVCDSGEGRDCFLYSHGSLFHKQQRCISFIHVSALYFCSVPLMRADYGDVRWKGCHFSADERTCVCVCVCVEGLIGDPSAPKPFYVYRSKGKADSFNLLAGDTIKHALAPWFGLSKRQLCMDVMWRFFLWDLQNGKSSLWLFLRLGNLFLWSEEARQCCRQMHVCLSASLQLYGILFCVLNSIQNKFSQFYLSSPEKMKPVSVWMWRKWRKRLLEPH